MCTKINKYILKHPEEDTKPLSDMLCHFFPIFDAVFDKVLEFGKDILLLIAHLYVLCYNMPFSELISSTQALINAIFNLCEEDRNEDPWTILQETELLEIICTIIPSLSEELQAPMLNILVQLTETEDEDGEYAILEHVDLKTIAIYLMEFDEEKRFVHAAYVAGTKVIANLMRFDPQALQIIFKNEETNSFFDFLLSEGTSQIKQIFARGLFFMINDINNEDIIIIFNSELIYKALIAIETVQDNEDIYLYLLAISHGLLTLFKYTDDNINANYLKFKSECISYAKEQSENNDEKVSSTAEVLISTFFPESF